MIPPDLPRPPVRRWLLVLAAIVLFALVLVPMAGVVGIAVLDGAQFGGDALWSPPRLTNAPPWGSFGAAAIVGIFVLVPFASAAMLVRRVPGRRRFLLPAVCFLAAIVTATALAWLIQVKGVRFYADTVIFVVMFAEFALPLFIAGLICCRRMRNPVNYAFWSRCARVAFALSAFLGAFQVALPIDMYLHRRQVERTKAYVEAVAREVQQETRKTGHPPAEISGILARTGKPPRLVARSALTYEVEDDAFVLRFDYGEGWTRIVWCTYRVPPGKWDVKGDYISRQRYRK